MTGTDKTALEPELARIVEEEEELAAAVRAAVLSARTGRPGNAEDAEALRELRDEAAEAKSEDLPALADQMHAVKSRVRVRRPGYLPDMREPYFGHMRLRSDGATRDLFLGFGTFIPPGRDATVIDWRTAPVARIFFAYKQGEEYEEEIADRSVTGILSARRVVNFEDGRLIQVIAPEGQARFVDGLWLPDTRRNVPRLSGGQGGRLASQLIGIGESGRKMPVVSALLDADQFAVVEKQERTPLLVIGSAGCGKTTVAMHRLARQVYRETQTPNPRNVVVIVPEEGLRRLAAAMLAELGMERARVFTFDRWVANQARRLFRDLPRRQCPDTPPAVIRFKRHPAFRSALRKFVERTTADLAERLERRLFPLQNAGEFFLGCPGPTPLDRLIQTERHFLGQCDPEQRKTLQRTIKEERQRLLEIENDRHAIVGDRDLLMEAVALSGGQLTESTADHMIRHTRNQFAEPAEKRYAHVDPERLKTVDGRSVDDGTPQEVAGTIDVEDYALMLELLRLLTGADTAPGGRLKTYRFVTVDEAQDLADVELAVVGRALRGNGSLTAAGDRAQHIDPGVTFSSWPATMAALGAERYDTVRLNVTYRCTEPIARFGHHVLGPLQPEEPILAPKKGVPVSHSVFRNPGNRAVFLAEALADLVDREPEANVAVITRDPGTAEQLHRTLQDSLPTRLVRNGEFSFTPGIDLTDVTQVKGLEFDYVIIPDADSATYPDSPQSRRMMHVAATRAIHQLWVISVRIPSPLLPTDGSVMVPAHEISHGSLP